MISSPRNERANFKRISLSSFSNEYLLHSGGIHTPKTVRANKVALTEFLRVSGDLPMHRVGVREVERFLAQKTREASVWSARKYHLALGSAFETARRWGYVLHNPFRDVPKPKPPELPPVFFSVEEFQKLLGHSSPTVTEVYSHLQPEHLHGTVNKITVSLN